MVDAGFLAAMPDGALLVNAARGPVVDTEALVAELTTGRLRAALDVTDPEPLPAGHPLWRRPGCCSPRTWAATCRGRPRAPRPRSSTRSPASWRGSPWRTWSTPLLTARRGLASALS